MNHLPIWIHVLLQLSTIIFAIPINAPIFFSDVTGRNIRHLPCVSLKSGETGVCMFAFTCAKANGTHLGTCIDRFYFGSCCKLNEEPEIYPEDNTIEEGPAAKPFVTTDGAIESNDISDYFTTSKTIVDKQSSSSTSSSSNQIDLITTQSVETSTESQRIITKRPFLSTPYTTTQPPIGLSTFQAVYNYSQHGLNPVTTENVLYGSSSSSKRPYKPISIESATVATNNDGFSRPKPSSNISASTKRPFVTETISNKPSSIHVTKPTTIRKPVTSSIPKPLSSTTERIPPSTRFPPRNATTTTTTPSVQSTTTKNPGQYSATKKPSVTTKKPSATTKKPSSSTRKPVTTVKPSSSIASTHKPTTITGKPFSTNVKVTQTIGSPVTSTQEPSTNPSTNLTTLNDAGNSTESKPSHRPITKRPAVTNGGNRFTTSRPFATSSKPRPSSIPIKTNITSFGKPTTVNTTPRPQEASTETIKPISLSSSVPSSSSSRPSILKPISGNSTRPRPTKRPAKPSKPTKPTRPSFATLPSIPTSTESPSTNHPSTLSIASSIYNGSTLTNEILPPKISETTTTTTEKVIQMTHLPGLVTWSSYSDDDVTKSPETSTITSDTTQNEAIEPEWSPISTSDGWVIIQSPTTEKPVLGNGTINKPKPTKIPSTSEKPSVSETTERVTTSRPTIPTILSTIATVTTTTDLPVPVEALNMSDYKQVCGRRIFPESRIVGGANSTFGKWPWQISLRQWRTKAYLHKCGAALLNENWAITAAHCVENVPPSDLLLRIGEHDLANEDEPYGFQERRVQIVASHPQFDPRTFEYDLALLRFYEPVDPFQPNILPICLPDDDENYVGHPAYVTGWGRLYEDGPLPSVLQETSVPVINNTVCEGMYRNAGYIEHIPHIFICAGWRKGGFDSCEGDSGGPMVIQRPRDKRWILAGVISWGIGCAEPNQPGVYTRISEFREWINQILQF